MASLLQVIGGAASGYIMSGGNPAGALIGGASAAASGNSNPITGAGNLGNSVYSAAESGILAQQQLDNLSNATFQLQLDEQSSAFNNMMDEKSEMMRESNMLRDLAMEQRKADNSITKEFIKSIN
jgi:hypothetical protein